MAKILLLETTTEVCSVAISEDGYCLAEKNSIKNYSHSEMITIMIQDCLNEVGISKLELDAVAISNGPGSYTGLRVGLSVSKGLAYALDIPIVAVSTLHALAFPYFKESNGVVVPMIDARREEVYYSIVDHNFEILTEPNNLILDNGFIDYFQLKDHKILFCGNGAFKVNKYLGTENANTKVVESFCRASNMATLAYEAYKKEEFIDLAYHEPFYLKSANITTPKKLV